MKLCRTATICVWLLRFVFGIGQRHWYPRPRLPVFSTAVQLPYNSSSAGMYLAVTNYGLASMKDTLADVMRRRMNRLEIEKVATFSRMGVRYEFTDLSVSEYSPPRVFRFFLTPNAQNQARLLVQGMNALLLVTLKTIYGNLPAARFAISMDDFEMTVDLRIRVAPNHRAIVDIPVCEMSAKRALVKQVNSEGAKKFGGFAKGWIRDQIKSLITGDACDTIRKTGSAKLTKFVNRYLTQIKIADLMPRLSRPVRAAPKYFQLDPDSFTRDMIHMVKQLVFDFSMVSDPRVKQYPVTTLLEVPLKGEVLFIGSTAAPFAADSLPPYYENYNKMFYLTVTEYTAKTLLYHLYREGYFNITLDGDHIKSPDIRYVLSTTCEDNECIGAALPEIAAKYPPQMAHIKAFVLGPPRLFISPYGLVVTPDVRIYVFALKNGKYEKAFVGDLRFTAVVNMAVVQNRLRVTSTLSAVKVWQKVPTVSNKTLARFARMIKLAIERYFNDVLSNDIRVPRIVFGRFHNFALISQPKRIMFSTNFTFNRRVLLEYLEDFLQKNFVENRLTFRR